MSAILASLSVWGSARYSAAQHGPVLFCRFLFAGGSRVHSPDTPGALRGHSTDTPRTLRGHFADTLRGHFADTSTKSAKQTNMPTQKRQTPNTVKHTNDKYTPSGALSGSPAPPEAPFRTRCSSLRGQRAIEACQCELVVCVFVACCRCCTCPWLVLVVSECSLLFDFVLLVLCFCCCCLDML